ncbi:MFS transporter [Streptomyces hawaiiensis]|jgi:predicted MFS family arabinose efflux permease|uniref:MFS transporter n=1 Tax=Streptomyces hawaiiensis TaxID=67305 RepID=UPI00365F4170
MSTRAWLLLLAVGLFAIGTDGYVIAGLLPEMGRDLGVSDSDTGHLVSAFALAYALGAPLLAVALGSLPRRLVLISSLTVFTAANVAAALVDSYETMIAVRVLAGLAAAVFSPGAVSVVPSLVPAERRGRALSTVSAGIAVSTAVGVPLGTLIGNAFGWRTTFLVVAALGALACLGLLLLLPPLPPNPPADLRTRVAASRTPGVPSALCVTVLWIAGAFTLLTYLSPVLDEVGNVHGTMLSIWLAIYGLAAVIGNHLGGRAADRFPTPRLTVVTTTGLLAALASFGLLGSLGVEGATGAGWAIVGLVTWGVFGWAFAPIQSHRLVQLAPESASVVLSLNSSAIYVGISAGGFLGSAALAEGGAAAVGWTAAAVELLAVLASLALLRRSAGKAERITPAEPKPSSDTSASVNP